MTTMRIVKQRVPMSGDAEWSDASRAILGNLTSAAEHPEGHGPPNILYTIAHHPTLLPAFLQFTATLASRGVLARRDSELLALRAAWNCRSPFEWGHHVEYALAAGMSEAEIEQIIHGPDDPGWTPRDRLLLQAADQLHADHDLDDATYEALCAELELGELVELTFVVGNYTMLSMVANATGVPLETRLPRAHSAASSGEDEAP